MAIERSKGSRANGMLDRARAMRRNMTPQEHRLWYQFLRTYPVKIYRQRIVGHYIVDFYCAKAKLAIEVDGGQHYTEEGIAYDRERTALLACYGLEIFRISNDDVNSRFDAVCQMIDVKVRDKTG